jgi:hypothetical protein
MSEATMVERVARALFETEWSPAAERHEGKARLDWEKEWPNSREYWLNSARAAMAAMRDPTDAMCAAGSSASTSVRPEGVPLIWRGMIDAALAAPEAPPAAGSDLEATTAPQGGKTDASDEICRSSGEAGKEGAL